LDESDAKREALERKLQGMGIANERHAVTSQSLQLEVKAINVVVA